MVLSANLQCPNCTERLTVRYALAQKPADPHVEAQCPVCRDSGVIEDFVDSNQGKGKDKRHVILVSITY